MSWSLWGFPTTVAFFQVEGKWLHPRQMLNIAISSRIPAGGSLSGESSTGAKFLSAAMTSYGDLMHFAKKIGEGLELHVFFSV